MTVVIHLDRRVDAQLHGHRLLAPIRAGNHQFGIALRGQISSGDHVDEFLARQAMKYRLNDGDSRQEPTLKALRMMRHPLSANGQNDITALMACPQTLALASPSLEDSLFRRYKSIG